MTCNQRTSSKTLIGSQQRRFTVLAQDFFRGVDLFKYLTESQLERMAKMAAKVSFPKGKIIKESDAPEGVYIVESGIAKVTKSQMDSSCDEAELGILREGSSFGELSTIDGLPRSANVTAMEPVTCYFLPRNDFMVALKETPEIGLGMLHAFASMVRSANNWASSVVDTPQDSKHLPTTDTPMRIASENFTPPPTPENSSRLTPPSTPVPPAPSPLPAPIIRSFRL